MNGRLRELLLRNDLARRLRELREVDPYGWPLDDMRVASVPEAMVLQQRLDDEGRSRASTAFRERINLEPGALTGRLRVLFSTNVAQKVQSATARDCDYLWFGGTLGALLPHLEELLVRDGDTVACLVDGAEGGLLLDRDVELNSVEIVAWGCLAPAVDG